MSSHPARVLMLVTALHFATHMYSTFLNPLNTELKEFFGLELDQSVTFFQTLYLVVYAAGNLIAGALCTRFPARALLALGPFLNGLAVAGMFCLRPGQYAGMCALVALGALGGGLYHPVANVLLTETFLEHRGRALGISGFGASLSFVVAPWSAYALVRYAGWSWQHVTLMYGVAGAACGALTYFVVPDDRRSAAERGALSDPAAAAPPSLRAVLLFAGLGVLTVAGREMAGWGVPVITRQYSDVAFGEATGAWYVNAGFLLAMMSLPGVLAQPLAGRWSDKLGRERVMGVSLAVVAAAVFALPRLGPEYVVFAYVVAGGFISASVPAFEALLADRTPLRYRGLVFGFAITAAIGSGALGPVLSGAAADAGGRTPAAYANAFTLLACLVAFSAVMAWTLKPAARRLGLLGNPGPG